MIIDQILTAFKDHIESLGIHEYDLQDRYTVDITPDEFPFPNRGQNTINIYTDRTVKESLEKTARVYVPYIEICITRRVTRRGQDDHPTVVYLSQIKSLSNILELIGIAIDSNNSLLSNINGIINSNKESIATILDGIPSGNLAANVRTAQTIGPVEITEFINRPIPRYDGFFTAYNSDREPNPFQPEKVSGYSMKLRVKGPKFILSQVCG